MNIASLVIFGLCGTFQFVNHTNSKEVTLSDRKVMKVASKTCEIEYKSCLKTLIKKENKTYHAICK